MIFQEKSPSVGLITFSRGIVKLGITAMAKVAAEVEHAGATCVPNAFYLGPAFLAVLHCLADKDKDSPLERTLADFGGTPKIFLFAIKNIWITRDRVF